MSFDQPVREATVLQFKAFRLFFALSIILLSGAAGAAGIKMTIPCQQNLNDGRILVDGTFLPSAARYKVLSYTPKSSDGGWSHGECQLDVTKGVSG